MSETTIRFSDLGLPDRLMAAIASVGYESPSPIQAETIPPLLAGKDVLGQAQTGTGKTAAFALPILSRIDLNRAVPQALVLAPTRELAIQVAEAFQRYAQHLPDFHVLPIYGGQGYGAQLHGLRRGAHVVVGTPGRIKDHLSRGTLDLSQLKVAVLDEADEMLRMGFIDDVESILGATPANRQVALFSATMPPPIKRIAQNHLKSPVEITIRAATTTASQIRQRYWQVSGLNKLDALTRILEGEAFEAMIIFARTKLGTEELAERLNARGFAAAAINGDLQQAQREKTIQRLRDGQLDILVATDVAARGLDVERITHVVNYDIPYDSEAYVHRIGRTGRAGRSGEAILFVTPRERHLLRTIERATRQPIEPMLVPTVQAVNDRRVARFYERIEKGLQAADLDLYRQLISDFAHQREVPELDVAAAVARMLQGDKPLLLSASAEAGGPSSVDAPRGARKLRDDASAGKREKRDPRAESASNERKSAFRPTSDERSSERPARASRKLGESSAPRNAGDESGDASFPRPPRRESFGPPKSESPSQRSAPREEPKPRKSKVPTDVVFERYVVDVGSRHGMKPGNLVGAVANEAGLDSKFIGRIDIGEETSTIELPEGMPKEVLQHLKKTWVAGRPLKMRIDGDATVPKKRGKHR
jgi:ATP-dependent RNA helicase DeaD